MVDLKAIAARLDDDKKLILKYRTLVATDGRADWVVRIDPLLDVAEDRGILYVDCDGEPIWVRMEEVIEVLDETDTALDGQAAG
jgi:hypothetical protein